MRPLAKVCGLIDNDLVQVLGVAVDEVDVASHGRMLQRLDNANVLFALATYLERKCRQRHTRTIELTTHPAEKCILTHLFLDEVTYCDAPARGTTLGHCKELANKVATTHAVTAEAV